MNVGENFRPMATSTGLATRRPLLMLAACLLAANSIIARATQENEVAPGHNLLVEGVPKVPASLARSVSLYKSGYGLPLAGWDTARRQLWLKALSATATRLSRLDAPGGSPIPIISIPAGGAYDVYLQPQGNYLVYNKDSAGDESFQFYLYDISARESRLITDGKSRSTEPVWSNAGDRIVYSCAPPGGEGVDLTIINPFDPRSARTLARGLGHYLKAYGWSGDDRKVVFCDYASNTVSSLWIIDAATGEKTPLSHNGGKGRMEGDYYGSPQFSRGAKGVYVITDHESEFRRLAYVDIATRRFDYLTSHIDWDVEAFKASPDGRTIAFVTNEEGISRLHLLDVETGKERAVPAVPPGIISDLEWHSNSADLAFNLKSPQTPNDVYSLGAGTGKLERWSKGFTGLVEAEKLPRPELIHWKSFDGRLIGGFLYRPSGTFSGRRPVIIDIHGGPEEQYRPGFGYEDNYFINELGVVKIYPNVRGSTGYGKTFARLDDGLLRMDAVKDVGALLDWVKEQPDLDAGRVLIQGASYGGFVALAAAANYGERIRGAISDAGPANLLTSLEGTAGWRRGVRRSEYGDERDPRIREFFNRIAPANNVDKISKPLMLIQGQNDRRVPAGESGRMAEALKKKGVEVWYLLAKDEGHDWARQGNLDFRLYAMALFVQERLLK